MVSLGWGDVRFLIRFLVVVVRTFTVRLDWVMREIWDGKGIRVVMGRCGFRLRCAASFSWLPACVHHRRRH